jgi:endogenous inhibitor of DNA gyrase (YacG/DUF329 family)
MRSKPVQRDEVRFDGWRIGTLPANSVRKTRQGELEIIRELWMPLLRSLRRAKRVTVRAPQPQGRWRSGDPETCRHCQRAFYRTRHAPLTAYCSDRCVTTVHGAAFRKTRSERRAAARADRKCMHCGEPIEAQRSTMKFCSVRCRVASHRAKQP